MGLNPVRMFTAAATLGGSELLGQDTMSKVPLLGPLMGAKSDAEKALIKKQQELAKEAELRQAQNQQARQQALAQSMMAFGPRNQAMSEMFGPEAAFSQQAMTQMAQDPYNQEPKLDPRLVGYQGMDRAARGEINEWAWKKKQWEAEQARLRQQTNFQDPRSAPQAPPLRQVTAQAGRRY